MNSEEQMHAACVRRICCDDIRTRNSSTVAVIGIITKVMPNGDDASYLAHEISTTVQNALESRLSTEHWAE